MEYPIIFAVDEPYVPYLSVAIQSIINNSNTKNLYKIFVLFKNIADESKALLKNQCNKTNIDLTFIDINKNLKEINTNLYETPNFSEAMYYRILIPELFSNYTKALYLDVDIIVNCDLAEFFELDLKSNILGVINDFMVTIPESYFYKKIQDLSLKPEEYFNSGVLLFDIKKALDFNLKKKFLEKLSNVEKLQFPDQTILNLILKDKILLLDYEYNFQWHAYYCEDFPHKFPNTSLKSKFLLASQNPKIIHFSGEKPWNYQYNNKLFASFFWKHAKQSPYYERILAIYTIKTFCHLDKLKKLANKLKRLRYLIQSKISFRKKSHYLKKLKATQNLLKIIE